jgi:hypothetical protein
LTNLIPFQAPPGEEPDLACYASFILRCWQGGEGCIRARLVDVHTGRSYLVADLDELPEQIQRLVAQHASSFAR